MTYFFIINPGSRHKQSAGFIPSLFAELDKRGIDYQYGITKSLDDAYMFSREANEKGYERVVAIGGDGTINKVLSGFYDETGKRISRAKLGVIHTGTSPDFCRSYGIPTRADLALETLLQGKTKEISIARIEYHNKTGESKIGYFACCASFGLGATVARGANSGFRKLLGDAPGTFASIVAALCQYKASDLILRCDGKEVIMHKNFNTFIGKSQFVASGMKIKNDLSHDDKRLYITSLKQINMMNVLPALRAIYSGKAIQDKAYISFRYAKSIEIASNKANSELEFDGDPQGYLPCRISVATDNLELIANEL